MFTSDHQMDAMRYNAARYFIQINGVNYFYEIEGYNIKNEPDPFYKNSFMQGQIEVEFIKDFYIFFNDIQMSQFEYEHEKAINEIYKLIRSSKEDFKNLCILTESIDSNKHKEKIKNNISFTLQYSNERKAWQNHLMFNINNHYIETTKTEMLEDDYFEKLRIQKKIKDF